MKTVKDNVSKFNKVADEKPATSVKLTKPHEVQFHLKDLDNSIYQRSPPLHMNQELNWSFRAEESDMESDPDCQENPTRQIANTPTPFFDALLRTTTSFTTQSEGTAMTSWDEWDEASDMLSYIDPIAASKEGVRISGALL